MIAFGKDDSLCEWDGKNWMIRFAKDESLRGLDEWDGWLCWMNRMIRVANGMKTLRFQDG